MSPILVWEGTGEVPNFCPQGCGGITEDPYGGPCKACWAAAVSMTARERYAAASRHGDSAAGGESA